jgi:CheY-like chemotaxis protein
MAVLVGVLARRAGLSVTCRQDVDAAWLAVSSDRLELVLLDVNLPIKSGLELLRRRHEATVPHEFSVALFCQPAMTRDVASGWREGADYLVAKDLVTRAGDWQQRVSEILDHVRGRASVPSLGWPQERDGLLLSRWGEVLNEALDHPCLRPLGVEVIEQVLWRAMSFAFGPAARREWLAPDSGRVVLSTPLPRDSGGVHRCFASLLDQAWRLLGSGPCAQFSVALRAAVNARHER